MGEVAKEGFGALPGTKPFFSAEAFPTYKSHLHLQRNDLYCPSWWGYFCVLSLWGLHQWQKIPKQFAIIFLLKRTLAKGFFLCTIVHPAKYT